MKDFDNWKLMGGAGDHEIYKSLFKDRYGTKITSATLASLIAIKAR